MTTFTINSDNNITAHAGPLAGGGDAQTFTSAKSFAQLTADWPASRLVETWNSFAGVAPFDDLKPVKKFTDRKAAVARIWKAVQRLDTNAALQGAPDAPKAKGPAKKATASKKAARAKQGAKEARNGSKKATVLDLMRRSKGVSLAEIMKVTGWQAHSVRGFISILGSRVGEKIESLKNDSGERTYRIAK